MGGRHAISRAGLLSLAAPALAFCAVYAQEGRGLVTLQTARAFPVESRLEPRSLSAPERAKVAKHPLGSKQNPVRCFTPAGERRYLERLRCSAGGAPAYERTGQGGIGPYGTALDAIRLTCAASRRARTIYMDMSHRGVVEKRAVPGFAIVPAGEEGGGT